MKCIVTPYTVAPSAGHPSEYVSLPVEDVSYVKRACPQGPLHNRVLSGFIR